MSSPTTRGTEAAEVILAADTRYGAPPLRGRCRRLASALALIGLAGLAGGCAASSALKTGLRAEQLQDYDRAVVEYTKAVRLKPGDTTARLSLDRAKLRAAADHFARGRRLAALGKFEEALVEYQLAAELNPASGEVEQALRETRMQLRARVAVAREGKTQLESLIDRARDAPVPGLELPTEIKMPASLMFRSAPSRDVFLSIAKLADLSVAFDSSFRDSPLTLDLRNATLEQALRAASDAARAFYRVTAARTLLVIPDTPAKRREYEDEVVRTFYLSNADLKETMDLLRMVLDARRISPISATNALTVKDTPERVAAAARVISAIDKARPEVIIDVELLEVDRTKLTEWGLQPASPGDPGINGSATLQTDDTNTLTLRSLRNLTQSDVLLANLPGLYYRLLKSDSNTRILANPQLRTSEGMAAQARFGQRIPVPVTTFVPIATGGAPQQQIASFNYENIGVNIDITPRTHHDDDVSLTLKVAVQSMAGSTIDNLPIFGNREINTVIRLRDGETNMLAGLIRDDERRVLSGVPGLSDIPVVGRLFAHNRTESTQTDIVLTLTPHIVRVLELNDADLQAFRVGRESGSPVAELPPAIELPRPTAPPAPGAGADAPPPPPPAGAVPIRPPQPAPPDRDGDLEPDSRPPDGR